jgi:hypothetical protein
VLDEGREDDPEGDPEGWLWQPVRVFTLVQEQHGQAALTALYRAYGEAVHGRGEWPDTRDLLRAVGLPESLAEAAHTSAHDELVRASHRSGIELVGTHVGTPVVAVVSGTGPRSAWFGLVRPGPLPRPRRGGGRPAVGRRHARRRDERLPRAQGAPARGAAGPDRPAHDRGPAPSRGPGLGGVSDGPA